MQKEVEKAKVREKVGGQITKILECHVKKFRFQEILNAFKIVYLGVLG